MFNKDETILIQNKRTLQLRKPKAGFYIYPIITIALIFSSLGFTGAIKWNNSIEQLPVLIHIDEEEPTPENIKNYIKSLNLDHPDIVYAQILLESGTFTSVIYKNNSNLFGMKMSSSRPSTAIREELGHAFYKDWKSSIQDYGYWQASYARNLTRKQYFKLLNDLYCSATPDYTERLKKLLK